MIRSIWFELGFKDKLLVVSVVVGAERLAFGTQVWLIAFKFDWGGLNEVTHVLTPDAKLSIISSENKKQFQNIENEVKLVLYYNAILPQREHEIFYKKCQMMSGSLTVNFEDRIFYQRYEITFISMFCHLLMSVYSDQFVGLKKYSFIMSHESKVVSPELVEKQIHDLMFKSKELETSTVKGYDFNQGVNYENILKSFATIGLQATHLSKAIEIVNEMISWRLSDEPLNERDDEETSDPAYRAKVRCTIFLGYTSNMVSCGMREVIRYLAQHKMIDCIVTSAGGIEEDIMKCMGKFHLGQFNMNDIENRLNGHCRIGNILVPNENYVKLQSFLLPLYAKMAVEQEKNGVRWTPSKFINRLGKEINNEQSIYYWCYKNDIPVFCPAITDGGIGDVLFTNSYKNDLYIDVVLDHKEISKIAMKAEKAGAIIIGGAVPKHHILNANIWRNGLDYEVLINTGLYEDGSDSGAKASEGYTWAKVRLNAKYVKIFSEATLVFPFLVGETFAKRQEQASKLKK